MLNICTFQGRFVRDPELRRTGNGTAVTSFTLAVDRDFGDNETDFIECVGWKNTAEFINKHFHKGKMAVVKGRLQIRSWTDKDGNKRKTAEVVVESIYFADSKKEDIGSKFEATQQTPLQDYAVVDGDDDSLPF